jgi:hypothetical protein
MIAVELAWNLGPTALSVRGHRDREPGPDAGPRESDSESESPGPTELTALDNWKQLNLKLKPPGWGWCSGLPVQRQRPLRPRCQPRPPGVHCQPVAGRLGDSESESGTRTWPGKPQLTSSPSRRNPRSESLAALALWLL